MKKKSPVERAGAESSSAVNRKNWLIAVVLLVVATVTAYSNSFSGPFVMDDQTSIVENQSIRKLSHISEVLSPPRGGFTVSGRPMLNLSLAINYAIGGTDVRGYHVFNLMIHLFGALALFGIVRRTLLKPSLNARFGKAAVPLAAAVAGLWAIHPLQTEAVTYTVQRAESLMAFFYLLTLYCFVRGAESRPKFWCSLCVLACLGGMATKEVMVSAPFAVLLYDRAFIAGSFFGALRARWRTYLGLGCTWLLLAYLILNAGELGSHRAGFEALIKWWPYALTQFWAITHYLWLALWPHPLVFDYGTPLVTQASQVVPCAFLVVALVVGVLVSLWRWPAIGFLGFCFFAILAPTSSVMPLAGQTVAEHRIYLSLAALIAFAVTAIYRFAGKKSFLLFAVWVVAFAALTARRNEDYRSDFVLWTDTAAKRPDNARAQLSLGFAFARRGQIEEAVRHYERALELRPDFVQAHDNLGVALSQQGKMDEALAQFQEAVRISPDYISAHNNFGNALLQLGRVDDAVAEFQKAMELDAKNADANYGLAEVLSLRGKTDDAIARYEKALGAKPDFAQAHGALGNLLLEKGQVDNAIAHYREALKVEPNDAVTHNNLASALLQNGNIEEAIAQCEAALELRPDSDLARKNLESIAWQLATSPNESQRNGRKAAELAEQANQLSGGNDPQALAILAAAYAESGRFSDAVNMVQQALQSPVVRTNTILHEELEKHLALYQLERPLRSP